MKKTVVVAGGTGNLGGRITSQLLTQGADVRIILRAGSDAKKVEHLENRGALVIEADMEDPDQLQQCCDGAHCVISALQGLRDVIVDVQKHLLGAAIAAGVPRFIPSDFSCDYTGLPEGENRNFDLRREFYQLLDQADIAPTSIFNGAFAEILSYGTPLLNLKKQTIGYWEDAGYGLDFTTMDDTAAFTAAAAIAETAPRKLHIASFQCSANELAAIASEVTGAPFSVIKMGTLTELAAQNKQQRAENPQGEQEIYPRWQSSQYIQSMFSVHNGQADNERFGNFNWTSGKDFIASLLIK